MTATISLRFGSQMTDAVEKVRGVLLTRNNRIIGVDFLNRTCALNARFGRCCSVSRQADDVSRSERHMSLVDIDGLRRSSGPLAVEPRHKVLEGTI